MDKPFYRNFFGRSQKTVLETTEARAEGGDAQAQFSLGLKFSNPGAAQNYFLAEKWYLKAADQSHSLAQFNLGIMYAQGQGVRRDEAKALVWIRKAADLGDAGAQYKLGSQHHRASLGELPEAAFESRIEAYKWLQLAAVQGYQDSRAACESVALTMTRESLADGRRRVAAFNALKTN